MIAPEPAKSGYNVNSHKLKRFVRNMIYASKKLERLNGARSDLSRKLDDMKKLPLKTIRGEMDGHLNELMDKVNFLVESEKKILSSAPHALTRGDTEYIEKINSLQAEISRLNNENGKLAQLISTVRELQSKVDYYEKMKDDREARIEELENRIRSRVDKSGTEIEAIEERLRMMSDKYEELVSSGRHSEEDLKAIRQRIDDLRILLESKKSSQ